MTEQQTSWHRGATIYQIYPRSFLDTNGTGTGNLRGITDKLDYLGGNDDSLGVTAIWISPIYTSPMADFGYDVANYVDIDPIFGTMDDFVLLLSEAHKRNIKVLLDLVPNHSSDEHPWFIESKSSLDNPKRDWYVWHAPKEDGSAPNNWLSVFGGSAWQYSEETQQYYLHSFLSKQPDLNWKNPSVREAMKDVMRFWLDLGVDGFRVDAVDWLSKDEGFQDDPLNPDETDADPNYDYHALRHSNSRDGDKLFERLNEMAEVLSAYNDRFMITEAHPETDDKTAGYLAYYKAINPELSAPFNFEGIYLPWQAEAFRSFVDPLQAGMQPEYTPIYSIGNHDESRVASRIGHAEARTAAMMLLTLPGVSCIYYGDELGMSDGQIAPEQIRDPFQQPGQGRDAQRTPMQWNNTHNAGFSSGTPWLPISQTYHKVNVALESHNPQSMLSLYKQLIYFRNQSSALRQGDYKSFDFDNDIFSYERSQGDEKLLIVLNFSNENKDLHSTALAGTVKLSTYLDKEQVTVSEHLKLRPNEGVIIGLKHD